MAREFRDRQLGNYNLHTASNGRDIVNTLYNGDNRLGFLMKDQRDDGMRYGVGIDNVGSPYRGISDNELNTLLGKLDYGYDGDTVAAGFTPNSNAQYVQALARALTGTMPLTGVNSLMQNSGNAEVNNGAKAAAEAALRNAFGGSAGYGAGLANLLNRR